MDQEYGADFALSLFLNPWVREYNRNTSTFVNLATIN